MATYKLISSVTVGPGGAADIEFTSIPATFTDLVVKVSARTNRALENDEISVTFNANTSSIYTYRSIRGNGSSVVNNTETNTTRFRNVNEIPGATATANTFGNTENYIPNYANTSFNKSVSFDSSGENNATLSFVGMGAGLFGSTSAVSSIRLFPRIGPNFVEHSTAYLYGISNA